MNSRDIIRMGNEAFRSGFDHAKKELLDHVDAALGLCKQAIREAEDYGIPPERNDVIRIRIEELTRIRSVIKGLKPEIAGG